MNGNPTQALVSVANDGPNPVTLRSVGGSLWTLTEPSLNLRNLTASQYFVTIPAGQKESVSYAFGTDMHPQDLRLQLGAAVGVEEGKFVSIPAYNSTVSVVEPDTSIFDPQV